MVRKQLFDKKIYKDMTVARLKMLYTIARKRTIRFANEEKDERKSPNRNNDEVVRLSVLGHQYGIVFSNAQDELRKRGAIGNEYGIRPEKIHYGEKEGHYVDTKYNKYYGGQYYKHGVAKRMKRRDQRRN